MKFISTRNHENQVKFEQAVLDCMPEDGGLYVPAAAADLRRWILYTDENTSFSSIAGALTSACINDEFSPIISETIATKAFPFEPAFARIDDRLFTLKLCTTPTGSHKDFGISYLVNCLETILTMKGRRAVFLDVTIGELGTSLARAIRGKKNLKAVLVYPRGRVRGLSEADFVWNGGNVFPLEIDGTEADCHKIVRGIFADHATVERFGLTVANTANIGRLMPHTFFYPFAFSRLKKEVCGDIYYAMAPGNYSNLVAGLYSWQLSLPVSGFICPTTDELKLDMAGSCEIMDGMVDFAHRAPADPASPSNLERLEHVFSARSLMLRHFLYPAAVDERAVSDACRELFMKYHIFADRLTSSAYAALLARREILDEDESSVVLVARDHPALSCDYIRHTVGEAPEIPDFIRKVLAPVALKDPPVAAADGTAGVLRALEAAQ